MAAPEKISNALYLNSLPLLFLQSIAKSMCSPSWLKHKDGCSDRCFWIFRGNKWTWKRGEGGFFPRWTKIACQGNFVWRTEKEANDQKNGLVAAPNGWQTVCVLYASIWPKRRSGGRFFEGGQQNDFRKQKLKGFSFVRISQEERKFSLG